MSLDLISNELTLFFDREPKDIVYARRSSKCNDSGLNWATCVDKEHSDWGYGFLTRGYVNHGNRWTSPEAMSRGRALTKGELQNFHVTNSRYSYNYPMQFWPVRQPGVTFSSVGGVLPETDPGLGNQVAKFRVRPIMRTVNFNPTMSEPDPEVNVELGTDLNRHRQTGWWGYSNVDNAMDHKRNPNPDGVIGAEESRRGSFARYRSRHNLPCLGTNTSLVKCLPCEDGPACNVVTSLSQSSPIPSSWNMLRRGQVGNFLDGFPVPENARVGDVFPCPMPDFVHRIGEGRIPFNIMSGRISHDANGEGIMLDHPNTNFYTCEYKSAALIDSSDWLRPLQKFVDYLIQGHVAPCCQTSNCWYVPSNATLPFSQGMPQDFAAKLVGHFHEVVRRMRYMCDQQVTGAVSAIDRALGSSRMAGDFGLLRTEFRNLKNTLLNKPTYPTDGPEDNNWVCCDIDSLANNMPAGSQECVRCDPSRARTSGPDIAVITPLPETERHIVDSVPKAKKMLCGPNFTRKNFILRKPADFWLKPRLESWGVNADTYLSIFRSGQNDESRQGGMWTHQAVADKAAPPNWYDPPFEIMCYNVPDPLWHDYEWVSTMRDPQISCKYFKPQDCVMEFADAVCEPSIQFYANDDPRVIRNEFTDTITRRMAMDAPAQKGKKVILTEASCGGQACPAWEWSSKSGKRETVESFECKPTYEAATWDENSCHCAGGEWRNRLVRLDSTNPWYHELGCRILPNSKQLYEQRFDSDQCRAIRDSPVPPVSVKQCFVDIPYAVSRGQCGLVPPGSSIAHPQSSIKTGIRTLTNTTSNPAYYCMGGSRFGIRPIMNSPTDRSNPACRDVPLSNETCLATGVCSGPDAWIPLPSTLPAPILHDSQIKYKYYADRTGSGDPSGTFEDGTFGSPCQAPNCSRVMLRSSIYDVNRRTFDLWTKVCVCEVESPLPVNFGVRSGRNDPQPQVHPFDPGMGIQMPSSLPPTPGLPQPLFDWTNNGFGNRMPICQLQSDTVFGIHAQGRTYGGARPLVRFENPNLKNDMCEKL